jgi:hypothetical protein
LVEKGRRKGQQQCSATRIELLNYSWEPGLFGDIVMTVFNRANPIVAAALNVAREEAGLWSLAGAKNLAALTGVG